jgi:hypothetical protein
VGRVLLLLVFSLLVIFGGWNWNDGRNIDNANGARNDIRTVLSETIDEKKNKTPEDYKKYVIKLKDIREHGGKGVLAGSETTVFTDENKKIAALILCVVLAYSEDINELEKATKHTEFKKNNSKIQKNINTHVENYKKAKTPAQKKLLTNAFKLGIAAGIGRSM